ncbi:LysR family transcriptional regulator [Gloeobacter morelensis]|uniref:LysR family transcriptional regulator n=1 Tax=Gloeobacter morelensis MG652769 TaxID=2781736 RepID=A0ABY3PH28_9CYAN|nr:LysR substrate-binding domain-containing protein [Gloeobacter morelensis]UFP92965.1 LysR family transcriptional regulator [Gloeobacter morelensis MG652769]
MNFEQLRVFVAVAEHLNFTRAAEKLSLSQPAVSSAVASLETYYKVPLFNRMGRRIELTNSGRLLLTEAHKVIQEITTIESKLRETKSLQRGELYIGSSQTVASWWLPPQLQRFRQQYPKVQLKVVSGNTEEIGEWVAAGQVDIGLVEREFRNKSLTFNAIGGDKMAFVVGKQHPFWERTNIELDELKSTRWVLREPGSDVRKFFEYLCFTHNIDADKLDITLELPNCAMTKRAAEVGAGVALLSVPLVEKEIKWGALRSLNTVLKPVMERNFYLISRNSQVTSPAVKAFSSLVRPSALVNV